MKRHLCLILGAATLLATDGVNGSAPGTVAASNVTDPPADEEPAPLNTTTAATTAADTATIAAHTATTATTRERFRLAPPGWLISGPGRTTTR